MRSSVSGYVPDMNLDTPANIVLIGMPGAGKSTVGVILAKQTRRSFIDTDILIQTTEQKSLQQILDEQGYDGFRATEERVLLDLHATRSVIATGGSAVYSPRAMQHLRENGIIVFLDVALPALLRRVTDFETRGIARRPGQTFAELFHERCTLYRAYADVVVECGDMRQEEVSLYILEHIGRHTGLAGALPRRA